MSTPTDTLAALLNECWRTIKTPEEAAHWLAVRGVVVLPPDHPLRSGEPSEAMMDAAIKAYNEPSEPTAFGWAASLERSVRAALAVLREPREPTT